MTKKIYILSILVVVSVIIVFFAVKTKKDIVPIEEKPVTSVENNTPITEDAQIKVLSVPVSSTSSPVDPYVKEQINTLEASQPASPPSTEERAQILKALQANN